MNGLVFVFFREKINKSEKKTGFGENRVNMQLAGRMLWKCISYATSGMNKSHPRIRRKKQEKKKRRPPRPQRPQRPQKKTKNNRPSFQCFFFFGILEHRKPHKSGRCTGSQAQKPQSYFFFFCFFLLFAVPASDDAPLFTMPMRIAPVRAPVKAYAYTYTHTHIHT